MMNALNKSPNCVEFFLIDVQLDLRRRLGGNEHRDVPETGPPERRADEHWRQGPRSMAMRLERLVAEQLTPESVPCAYLSGMQRRPCRPGSYPALSAQGSNVPETGLFSGGSMAISPEFAHLFSSPSGFPPAATQNGRFLEYAQGENSAFGLDYGNTLRRFRSDQLISLEHR